MGLAVVEPNEREDLDQFLTHPGWLRFQAYVKTEWGSVAFARKLKEAAVGTTDAAQAVLRVNAAHDAVNELMLWPAMRLKVLVSAEETRKREKEPPLSRRGSL